MPDYRESSHALEVARVVEELERIVAAGSVAPAAADSARRSKPLVVGPRHTGRRLGALLVTRGYIMEDELERALAVQERTGERLGEVLLRLNFIGERDLTELLAAAS